MHINNNFQGIQMFKIFTLALAFFLYPLSVNAAQYVEGKHYSVVSPQKSNKQELREYFSFYCPACRGFEPYVADFKKGLPTGATLEKTHVDFMGHTSPEIQFMLGKALILAEKSGIAHRFTPAMFKYLQTDRATISSEKDVRNIFVLSGGNGDTFDKSINNFSIVSQAKRNKKTQDRLSNARQLTSVPSFLVNGKYLINTKALDQKNMIQDYKNIIAYLFTL
ncbi:MAG: thiol:disulfide interchange protein DsbA [Alteromonadaceae bacterium]|jgi:thiol:disulfide interchange protein DsbA